MPAAATAALTTIATWTPRPLRVSHTTRARGGAGTISRRAGRDDDAQVATLERDDADPAQDDDQDREGRQRGPVVEAREWRMLVRPGVPRQRRERLEDLDRRGKAVDEVTGP